jgi:hypothetical protein
MLRASLCSMTALVLLAGAALAVDAKKDDKDKKGEKACITKVDAKNGTVTVKMKDKDGKETERKFTLTGEEHMFDDNGKTIHMADIDVFRSGDYVLIVERDGKLREMRKDKDAKKPDSNKSGGK